MKEVKFWEFLIKVYLEYFEEVKILAMGRAIHLAVRASNNVVKKKLAVYAKMETLVSKETNQKTKNKKSQIKPSIKIILKKSPDFHERLKEMKNCEQNFKNENFENLP